MNSFFCGGNSGKLEVFCVKGARRNLYKCDVIQLLKKEGTEKYLFGDSGFLSVSKEPGLRVLLVRCSGFLGFSGV